MTTPPPVFLPAEIEKLRVDLAALGSLDDALGPVGAAALAREEPVPGRLAARAANSPEAAVALLFLLGDRVPSAVVDRAFPTLGAAGAQRLGLVQGEQLLSAAVNLQPVEVEGRRLWFTSDRGERVSGRALAADHVLGVGGASLTLAAITDRRTLGRVLDLGTGCGIQAALAHGHADSVTATDISARALEFAKFNAALNGQGWDLRAGSMFAPVTGERFDLIVSNPPFVITPAAAYGAGLPVMEYRDAGAAAADPPSASEPGHQQGGEPSGGDRLLATVLAGLREHLTPTGTAHILSNWEHRAADSAHSGESHTSNGWPARLAALAGPTLDLWVIERELLDPAEYVEMWLRDGGTHDPARRDAIYAAWLADFAARGVEGIGFGYILAAPTPAHRPALQRFEAVGGPAAMPIGAHLAACFAAQRRQADDAAAGDGSTTSWRVVTAPDVTLEHHYRPGEDDPAVIVLRQGAGLGRTRNLDTALAGLISVADGELTVGQVADALAELLGAPADALRRELDDAVRELVATGFLVRAD